MRLTSSAFHDGATIPETFTHEGVDTSPPLEWSGAPKEARSFVVFCEDPEAPRGVTRHWGAFDIPAYHSSLVEGAGRPESFEDFRHAINDFGRFGYSGPRPYRYGLHHYRFRLLALDCAELPIRTHPTCAEVELVAHNHLLAEASLTGVYTGARRAAS